MAIPESAPTQVDAVSPSKSRAKAMKKGKGKGKGKGKKAMKAAPIKRVLAEGEEPPAKKAQSGAPAEEGSQRSGGDRH